MASILLADDERTIREGLRALLVGEGYSVRTATNGADALEKFSEVRPDLVLLDVMMPKLNGYVVCTEIRKTDRTVPIVFLTAKDSDVDEVRGMDLGADDFISKSENDMVLLARIRRAIERSAERSVIVERTRKLRLGSVVVDMDRRIVQFSNRAKELTSTEADLLVCLSLRRGQVVSAEEILDYLRGKKYEGDTASVRTHVKNLRKKLGPAGEMIGNVVNVGYYLVK